MLRVQVNGKRRDIGLDAVAVEAVGSGAFGDHDPVVDTSLMLRSSLKARKKATALCEFSR